MAPDLSKPVLIVDDFLTMTRIVRTLLAQIGFTDIDDAQDGPTALSRLRERKYGLVICDWHMEPMTGQEVLIAMRKDPVLAKIPFVMMTADTQSALPAAAMMSGADGFIVKPFNAVKLSETIETVLKNRKKR